MLLKKIIFFSPKQKRHQIASSEEKRENKRQRSYRQLKVENKWKIGCASQLPVAYFKVFSESLFFLQHRLLLLLFNELKLPQLQCNSSQSQTVKRRKGSDLLVLHYHQHHPQHSTPLPAEIPTTTLSFLLSPHPPPPPSKLSPLHPPPPPRDAEFYSTVCRIPVCSAHSSMQSNTAPVEERWRQLSSAGCCSCCSSWASVPYRLISHSPIRDGTGGRERETERESLEVSGVERQVEWKSVERKKRLQHLPSSLSFLPSAFSPSFLCWLKRGRRRGERKGSFKN